MNYLEFVETSAFSGLRKELMDDDEFRELQTFLLEAHERGDTISHTGGCKKIRWSRPGMGEARWCQSDLLRSLCQRQIIPASDIP